MTAPTEASAGVASIWKFPLALIDAQVISIPEDAAFLCAQMQGNSAVLWARVDLARPMSSRTIYLIGTGHIIPAGAESYIGTVQLRGAYDGLVFHVYAGSQP